MRRVLGMTMLAAAVTAAPASAGTKFVSTWKAPGAAGTSFAGKKVAAVVISSDESLRVSGEEALAQRLVAAVITRAEGARLVTEKQEPTVDLLMGLGQFGQDCRAIGMNCLGDNQDASYFLFKPKPLDAGKVYALVGTLATETGNATYVGLSVNDASLLKGVLNISDEELKGSANTYGAFDKFFVHFFTRNCDAIVGLPRGACTTVTADMVPLEGDSKAPGDPALHGMFSAAVRAYVKPGSERGPDSTKQLRPWVLTFSLK